ncbi:superoxide dismutase [bacterium]|nr:superoxide dismutase [bacterium]
MFSLDQFPLPFTPDALAPYMSAQTIGFHYGRHLAGYIKTTNDLTAGTAYQDMPLADIIMQSAADDTPLGHKIFNNAAQIFNHAFFFRGLRRDTPAPIPHAIIDAFGSADQFRSEFAAAARDVFGSGWTWLVRDGGKLRLINTQNADTPMTHGARPILALDVWEHAYYLDYQNRRGDFIDAFLNHLIDWDWVSQNL